MNKNPIFAILWLLLLVFIAWPVAGFCAGIWIFLQVRLMSRHVSFKENEIDRRTSTLCVVHSLISFISANSHFHFHSLLFLFCFILIELHLITTMYNSRLKLALTLSSKLPRCWKSSLLGPVTAAWQSWIANSPFLPPCKTTKLSYTEEWRHCPESKGRMMMFCVRTCENRKKV